MASPLTFANNCAACVMSKEAMRIGFKFPPIYKPGLPNFTLGTLAASMGGISYVLKYIPPTPLNLPKMPSIKLFVDPFLANIQMPLSYPTFSALGITIPGVGIGPYAFDVSGMFKLIVVCIRTVFEIFISIIKSILNLALAIPGVSLIIDLFKGIALKVGLAGDVVFKFASCLAKQIVELLTSLIPV